jgi:hypothetical protein
MAILCGLAIGSLPIRATRVLITRRVLRAYKVLLSLLVDTLILSSVEEKKVPAERARDQGVLQKKQPRYGSVLSSMETAFQCSLVPAHLSPVSRSAPDR